MKNGILLPLFLFVFGNGVQAQSGWVQEKGGLYAQASAAFFSSDDYFGLNGEANPMASEFRQQALNLYAEYGLAQRFSAILNTSALRINSFASTDFVVSPGDLRLGIKYALSKKIPFAISIEPEIPLGKQDNFAVAKETNDLGFKDKINLATTDGEVNVWTTLAISTSFPSGKGWASAFGGYNLRSKGFSDQLQAGLEVGLKPTEKFYVKSCFNMLTSLGDAKQNVPFFRGEGTAFTAVSLGTGWQFGHRFGVAAEFWRSLDFLVGPKNAYIGPVFSLGITYQLKAGTD